MTRPIRFIPRPGKQQQYILASVENVKRASQTLNEQRAILDGLLCCAFPEFAPDQGDVFDLNTLNILGPEPMDENGVSPDAQVT